MNPHGPTQGQIGYKPQMSQVTSQRFPGPSLNPYDPRQGQSSNPVNFPLPGTIMQYQQGQRAVQGLDQQPMTSTQDPGHNTNQPTNSRHTIHQHPPTNTKADIQFQAPAPLPQRKPTQRKEIWTHQPTSVYQGQVSSTPNNELWNQGARPKDPTGRFRKKVHPDYSRMSNAEYQDRCMDFVTSEMLGPNDRYPKDWEFKRYTRERTYSDSI